MARDYSKYFRDGVYLPRWAVLLLVLLGLAFVGLKILTPPRWIVQRLDSPDGTMPARLMREQYLRHSFSVQVKPGRLWQTIYYTTPISNDYRIDLNERLVWSPDSRRLYLEVKGQAVWAYDFLAERRLTIDELPLHYRQKAREARKAVPEE